MPIAACEPLQSIRVTKSIVGNPLTGGGNLSETTLSTGDAVSFAIVVQNTAPSGGPTVAVDVTDVFDADFTEVTWTRTNPNASTTPGTGNISSTNVSLTAGQQVSWLVEATYQPADCTPLTVNVVKVQENGSDACCDSDAVYSAVKIHNGGWTGSGKVFDPTEGWTAMEVLTHLFEGLSVPLDDRVTIAKFLNTCGNLADLITGASLGGDGVAVELTDAFGEGLDLFAEQSAGF